MVITRDYTSLSGFLARSLFSKTDFMMLIKSYQENKRTVDKKFIIDKLQDGFLLKYYLNKNNFLINHEKLSISVNDRLDELILLISNTSKSIGIQNDAEVNEAIKTTIQYSNIYREIMLSDSDAATRITEIYKILMD
jgi:hypothetical protein